MAVTNGGGTVEEPAAAAASPARARPYSPADTVYVRNDGRQVSAAAAASTAAVAAMITRDHFYNDPAGSPTRYDSLPLRIPAASPLVSSVFSSSTRYSSPSRSPVPVPLPLPVPVPLPPSPATPTSSEDSKGSDAGLARPLPLPLPPAPSPATPTSSEDSKGSDALPGCGDFSPIASSSDDGSEWDEVASACECSESEGDDRGGDEDDESASIVVVVKCDEGSQQSASWFVAPNSWSA